MESISPSPSSSTYQPDSGTKETPFAQTIIQLTKQQYIQLKWNSRYWQRQRERVIARELVWTQTEAWSKLKCRLLNKSAPHCNADFDLFTGTEDSDIIEINVKAYVRKIKCQRYKKTCQCSDVPGLIAAPPAPRLIPNPCLTIV